jgi:2-keto-3-deoxy-L-rhamnonate aldolase RhmA
LEGIDVICLGAFDMSVSAGHTGNFNHPEVCEALDKILAACREHKIPVMHPMTFMKEPEAWVAKGVRLIYQSADSILLARAFRSFLTSMSRLRSGEKESGAMPTNIGESQ